MPIIVHEGNAPRLMGRCEKLHETKQWKLLARIFNSTDVTEGLARYQAERLSRLFDNLHHPLTLSRNPTPFYTLLFALGGREKTARIKGYFNQAACEIGPCGPKRVEQFFQDVMRSAGQLHVLIASQATSGNKGRQQLELYLLNCFLGISASPCNRKAFQRHDLAA